MTTRMIVNGKEYKLCQDIIRESLVFSILYTILFVFDGVGWLTSLMPSAIASYLVYVVLALYGFFLVQEQTNPTME